MERGLASPGGWPGSRLTCPVRSETRRNLVTDGYNFLDFIRHAGIRRGDVSTQDGPCNALSLI